MIDQESRRRYERIRVSGSARVMMDTSAALCLGSAQLIDLCEGGCAIFTHVRLESNVAGRDQVAVGGIQIWLPVRTRWVRAAGGDWTVGCSFDRPTDEKRRAIRALVWERRKLVRS